MVWYRCSVRSFFLMFQWGFVQRGRVLSIITRPEELPITLQESLTYNRSTHNVVNYRDAPFQRFV